MKQMSFFALLILSWLAAGCGPSPEEIAALTASAWTPTPLPTSTPTPIPYDLTLKVMDDDGNPIPWAEISLSSGGEAQALSSDAQSTLTNLPGADFSASVIAQGYFEQDVTATLERGANDLVITMDRAPFALLPNEACAANENLLYMEDFQDGEVSNWNSYPQGTQFFIEDEPGVAENKVLALNFGEMDAEYQVNTIPNQENVVRRLKYNPGDHSRFNAGLGFGDDTYFVVLDANAVTLNYFLKGSDTQNLGTVRPVWGQRSWHTLEFSTYGENIEVWLDGTPGPVYTGPKITTGNILHIGAAFLPADSIVLIDDISVCGLSEPFKSLFAPSP